MSTNDKSDKPDEQNAPMKTMKDGIHQRMASVTGFSVDKVGEDLVWNKEKLVLVGVETKGHTKVPLNRFYAIKSKKWIVTLKNPDDKTTPIEVCKVAEDHTEAKNDREMSFYWRVFNNPNTAESQDYMSINGIKYIPH